MINGILIIKNLSKNTCFLLTTKWGNDCDRGTRLEAVVARMQGRKKATSQKVFDTTETEKSKTKLWIERERREGEVCVCV